MIINKNLFIYLFIYFDDFPDDFGLEDFPFPKNPKSRLGFFLTTSGSGECGGASGSDRPSGCSGGLATAGIGRGVVELLLGDLMTLGGDLASTALGEED